MEQDTYLGVGLYSIPEAARIIGVDSSTLRRWVNEYYYMSRGQRYKHQPVIRRRFSVRPVLSFLELVELLFVRLFRQEGVPMETIRRASERASQLFETDYPFAVKRFDTDGARIFATLSEDKAVEDQIQDLAKGQFAFEAVVKPFFRKLEYQDSLTALTIWPRDKQGRIVIDPERNFGKPVDAETGVPT